MTTDKTTQQPEELPNLPSNTRKSRADKGKTHQKVEKQVVTSHRRKSNITVSDIGKWYTDGTDIWILDSFIPEPQVSMVKIASETMDAEKCRKGAISDFQIFRRLIPEPIRKRSKKE